MSPKGQTARLLIGVLLLTLASFTFSTCGGTGIDLAGGGVSGTGVSTGAITSFGSVEMNGVHYLTDSDVAPDFVTHKMSHGDGPFLRDGPGPVSCRDGRDHSPRAQR